MYAALKGLVESLWFFVYTPLMGTVVLVRNAPVAGSLFLLALVPLAAWLTVREGSGWASFAMVSVSLYWVTGLVTLLGVISLATLFSPPDPEEM